MGRWKDVIKSIFRASDENRARTEAQPDAQLIGAELEELNRYFFQFINADEVGPAFRLLRQAFIRSQIWDPYSIDLHEIHALLGKEDFQGAHDAFTQAAGNLLLSPSAHLCGAHILKKLGEEERSNLEGFLAARCVEGILSTGDGSRESPYLVTRASDEYDVLQYSKRESTQQEVLQLGERNYDKMTVKDGGEIWFDVTDMHNKLSERMSADG